MITLKDVCLVGELNPYGDDPDMALYPLPQESAGGRMQRLVTGLPQPDYMALRRVNLCVGRWSMRTARAEAMKVRDNGSKLLVLLGRKVAGAFWAKDPPAVWTTTALQRDPRTTSDLVTVVLLPHPSGLCREWNAPGSFQRARALLEAAAPSLPWGATELSL